jgi:outer membrane lipoprotein-sorting protein
MRFQRFGAVFVLCALPVALVTATQNDLFDEIYARGKPIESGLKTLTARFTETSTSSLLATPLVATGTLAVLRPSKVVLHYTAPEQRTVLIDGDTLRIVWPARAIDQKTNIGAAQRRIQQYFVDKSPAQLRSHFDIVAQAAVTKPGSWAIVMTPRRKQIREGLTKLQLWIDQQTTVLTAMEMTFPSGDTKLMEFADVKINPAIDAGVFTP